MIETQNRYYNKLIKKYKTDRKIVGWGSQKSQEKRFQILINYISKDDKIKLLDVGCGRADLFGFFKKKKFNNIVYTGLDLNKSFIKIAKRKFKKNSFINKDFIQAKIKKYDIIFISGLFNLRVKNHNLFLERMIKKGISKSNKIFIFNVMSIYAPFKEKKFFYSDPLILSKFIKKYSTKFIIDHSYFDHDFTIVVYK